MKYILLILQLLYFVDCNIDNKYFFLLSPSKYKEKPYIINAYIPNSKLLEINTSDGDNGSIIENKSISEIAIQDLSSVFLFKNNLIIKTCFGPNKIVEIINEKNEVFLHKNNNSRENLANIKFCYSSEVYDPKNENEYLILTYWTEFEVKNGIEIYSHKIILFDMNKNEFSEEITLKTNFNKNFYTEKCTTLKNTDIYCDININDNQSSQGSFLIEVKNIYKSENISPIITGNNANNDISVKNLISMGLSIYDIIGSIYQVFLGLIFDKTKNLLSLVKNNYRKSQNLIYAKTLFNLPFIEPALFNSLYDDDISLIYLYINQNKNLVMSRYDINYSKKLSIISDLFFPNYLRDDICKNPKYMQSIFINSLIYYNKTDQEYINNNGGSDNFYKYQKDIFTLITCENDKKEVYYESKKISMLQCLNRLDSMNGKANHIIKFKNDENFVIFDIYNDINYISLRNTGIEFLPLEEDTSRIIINYRINNGEYKALERYHYNKAIYGITHIRFTKTSKLGGKPISFYYRLSQNENKRHLFSEKCQLEFQLDEDEKCDIPYCDYCENSTCLQCTDIKGLTLDKETNKCLCDKSKGFNPEPEYNMCFCKEGYQFYQNITNCEKETVMPTDCQIEKEDTFSKLIYCPETILPNETKGDGGSLTDNEGGSINDSDNINSNESSNTSDKNTNESINTDLNNNDDLEEDVCLDKNNLTNNIWFNLGEYNFYYSKFRKCVYIFDGNLSLFFYSNRSDCSFDSSMINNISECLNISYLTQKKNYEDFLNKAKEYDPYSKDITIFKKITTKEPKIKLIHFHLVNSQKSKYVSDIQLSEEVISEIKNISDIPDDLDLLIFKADINRTDTISTQVEYQFYNPIPSKINEKIIFIDTESSRLRRLDDIYVNISDVKVNISVLIDWPEDKEKIVKELYQDNHIFIFNLSDPFFNDVCYKFTNSNKTDVYLKDRRDRYYIRQPFCEEGCNLVDGFNYDEINKLLCQCPMKRNRENFSDINFTEPYEEENNNTFVIPNIYILKCYKDVLNNQHISRNIGFYFNFFLLVIYFGAYIIFKKNLFCLKNIIYFILRVIFCGACFYDPFNKFNKDKDKELKTIRDKFKDIDDDANEQPSNISPPPEHEFKKDEQDKAFKEDNKLRKAYDDDEDDLSEEEDNNLINDNTNKQQNNPKQNCSMNEDLNISFDSRANPNNKLIVEDENEQNKGIQIKVNNTENERFNENKDEKDKKEETNEKDENKKKEELIDKDDIINVRENEIDKNVKKEDLIDKEDKNEAIINNANDENAQEIKKEELIDDKNVKKGNLIDEDNDNLNINNIFNQNNDSLKNSLSKENNNEVQLINFGPENEDKNSVKNSDSFPSNKSSNINNIKNSKILIMKENKNKNKNKKKENNNEKNNTNNNEDQTKKTAINLASMLKKNKRNIKNEIAKPKKKDNNLINEDKKTNEEEKKDEKNNENKDDNKNNDKLSNEKSILNNFNQINNVYDLDSEFNCTNINNSYGNQIFEEPSKIIISKELEENKSELNIEENKKDLISEFSNVDNSVDKKDENEEHLDSLVLDDNNNDLIEENNLSHDNNGSKDNSKIIANNFTIQSDKKKKVKKKHKNNSNPPPKSNKDSSSCRQSVNGSDQPPDEVLENLQSNQEVYLQKKIDRIKYNLAVNKDKRTFCNMLYKMIKKNNTILFIICFSKGNDDIYSKITVAILTIYLYIFVNIILMYNSFGLHLYIRKENEQLNIPSFFLNIIVPYLTLIYPVFKLKKYLSVKENIDDLYYKLYSILIQYYNFNKRKKDEKEGKKNKKERKGKGQILEEIKELNESEKNLKIHNIETEISLAKNTSDKKARNLFIFGGLFIIFIWYYMSCFCEIYENSVSCLFANIIMSAIFAVIISTITYFISSVCRRSSIKNKSKCLFCMSQLLNPQHECSCKYLFCCDS